MVYKYLTMLSNGVGFTRRTTIHSVISIFKRSRASSSISKPVIVFEKIDNEVIKNNDSELLNNVETNETVRSKSKLVATAFASLKKNNLPSEVDLRSIDESIAKASSPETLLTLVDSNLNKHQALKILSILAEWSVSGGADMKLFESDKRFISLCQFLGQSSDNKKRTDILSPQDNLSVVLNVKNDDEATKIISSFTITQMIKVLSSLAHKKRRSPPLLRNIAFHLSQCKNKLNIKQNADILYALASLNFPDEVLLEKVCSDLCELIPKCVKTSVIGSIATSVGLLRFKDIDLLQCLCDWMLNNKDICRPQDLVSFIYTLAVLNHIPVNIENMLKELRPIISQVDGTLPKLDIIWSLSILGYATHDDFHSVLSPDFTNRLKAANSNSLSIPTKKKLLNVNGAATWTKGYKGPLLELDSELKNLEVMKSKEKEALITSVFDALSNLLPSSTYLKRNVDLGMGFILEGECLLDSKLNPLPLVDKKTGEPIFKPPKGSKIGIFVWDYHEHTKGCSDLCGYPSLCERLAKETGYRVLSVPYNQFTPQDKLISRVQYLEKRLKLLVSQS